jgi:hypothetical protein
MYTVSNKNIEENLYLFNAFLVDVCIRNLNLIDNFSHKNLYFACLPFFWSMSQCESFPARKNPVNIQRKILKFFFYKLKIKHSAQGVID